MKKILLVVLMLFCFPILCHAEHANIYEQYKATGASEVLRVTSEVFPDFDPDRLVSALAAGEGVDVDGILNSVWNYFIGVFKTNFKLCMLLIAASYIMGVFSNMQLSFGGKGASSCAYVVSYCVFAGILTACFSSMTAPVREMIENVSVLIQSTIPILLTLLTLGGNVVTSGLLSQVLIGLVNVVNIVISSFVVPLIFCSYAVSVTANMSGKIKISRLFPFLHKLIKWVLLFMMAIYTGFFGIYGLSGNAIDGTAGKALRFAVGNGIPLVGGVAADSIETVLATLSATKNIIGVVGMCAVFVLAATPVLNTAASMWMFRLCAVVLEPFSDTRAVKLMADTAECFSLLFACMIAAGLLFISAIGVILLAGQFVVR